MRLGARKARHLDVSEVIVFGVISGPSLDVVASVGAAIQKRRHDLTLFFFLACARVSVGTGLRKGAHAREPGADRVPRDGLF